MTARLARILELHGPRRDPDRPPNTFAVSVTDAITEASVKALPGYMGSNERVFSLSTNVAIARV